MPRPTLRLALLVAVAALPAALVFLGHPFAVVALGLDGVAAVLWTVDLALARSGAAARLSRILPDHVLRGRPFEITLVVENPSPRPIDVRIWDRLPVGFSPRSAAFALRVSAFGRAVTTWRAAADARGDPALLPPAGERCSPLGFATWPLPGAGAAALRVIPDVAPAASFDALLRQRRLAELGVRPARERGEGTEIVSLRPYASGDPYGVIDWKATARMARLVSRERQAERRQTVVLLVDAGRRMAREASGRSRLDRAIEAALLLGHAALRADDRVGLVAFADKPLAVVAPLRTPSQGGALARALYALQPVLREPPYSAIAARVLDRFPRRALVVLFTDVAEPTAIGSLAAPLRFLSRRHLVLCAVFQDPAIAAAMRQPPADLGALYSAGAAAELWLERARGLAELRRAGVRVLEAAAAELPVAAVNEYLKIKARRLL